MGKCSDLLETEVIRVSVGGRLFIYIQSAGLAVTATDRLESFLKA